MKNFKQIICSVFIFCFVCFFFLTMPVSAIEKSKKVNVTLPQDYVQCTFYVSFENEILRETTLKSPNGDIYTFEKDDNETLSCTVKDAKVGEWQIIASTKLFLDTDSEDEATQDSGDATVEDIGKMTINVKSEAETKKSVSDSIKIAKEITGLNIYWKDDNLEIEWTDDTVGNVNIVVANSKTLQVIKKTTVNEKKLEVPVEPDVEEVLVNIVPSTSAGVQGAEQQFIIAADNHPDASISFEDLSITNKDVVKATASLNKSYSLLAIVNNEDVKKTDKLNTGEHELEIPLTEGANDIKVYVVDAKGNMRSTSVQITKDTVPPELKIIKDVDELQTYENEIEIQGTVVDYDSLVFRNENIKPEWDGTFKVTTELKEGTNTIEIKASDNAGNEAVYMATVTMLVKEPVTIPWNIILPFIAIIIGTIILFIIKKKEKRIPVIKKTTIKEKTENKTSGMSKSSRAEYICFAIIVIIIIATFQLVLQRAKAVSGSMEPTINVNEAIYVNKLAYMVKEPQRGDIVIFHSKECSNQVLLKRIIGVPGDKITFCDGYVLINGVVADETAYLDETVETNCQKSFEVPNNFYFMMGDNRSESYDARYWDNPYIQKNEIIGKMLLKSSIMNIIKKYI